MKSIKVLVLIAALFVLPFISGNASGEMQAGTYSISPSTGAYVFGDNQDIRNAAVHGLALGYNFTEHVGAEGKINLVYTDSDSGDNNDVRVYNYGLDGLYHFMPDTSFVPYVVAGFGALHINDDRANRDNTNAAFNYGAGIKYFLSKSLALRGDVRNVLDLGDSDNNMAYTIGFTYLFGGGVQKDLTPAPMDSDGDGVYDDMDECPDTARGVLVNAKGCPLDSDGDGVYDGLDQCPDTPAGAVVDGVGCPLDSDGDGVYDGLDRCPDTPRGAIVDSVGCPLDSDGDGVYDGLDKCPDTPMGIKVDEKGCPLPIKEKVSIELKVEFDFDSAAVKGEYSDHINKVAKFLKTYSDVNAVIEGHTCNIGTEDYNMQLSRKRAESVMQYLINNGVDSSRLKAVGYGESRPVADNTTIEGRSQNRRVMAELSTVVIKLQ